MAVHRAFGYFFREAVVNLARSWKISLVAVSTIAVSLFIGGALLLLIGNLQRLVAEWRREAKVIVYLRPGVQTASAAGLAAAARKQPWVTGVDVVTAEEARQRFERYFPSVADLVHGWGEEPLPASLEVAFDPGRVEPRAFEGWVQALRRAPQVGMVDDDRDWVGQLEDVLQVIGGIGLAVVAVLLVAAIFTIASVIRLTAYLYREEIGVMRLVGATELFIRGPFYVEGLLQGLLGGTLAVGGLYLGHLLLEPRTPRTWLAGALTGSFLSPRDQLLLVALGALAGLAGAVASLRREEV
jgi:cell division transport system permease protein